MLVLLILFTFFITLHAFLSFNNQNHGLNRKYMKSQLNMGMSPVGLSNVALVTPMTPNGNVDYSALEGLLKWHYEQGKMNYL